MIFNTDRNANGKRSICARIVCLVFVLAIAFGMLAGLTGCSSKEKLYVFNWGDYIDPEVVSLFEKEYPQYKVVYDTFDTNETMYQKLVSTNISYDVVIPSDYMISRLIKEDRLIKLDKTKLTNYGMIKDDLKQQEFDPADEYSVPYMWGTLGIVYNKKLVGDDVIDSWTCLWDKKYEGCILMLDSVRDTMGLTLKMLGYSMNTTDEKQIEEAGKKLVDQKALVAQYGVDDIKQPMINGNYALCVEYSGDALWMMDQNEDLEYVIPKEGSNIWIDSMVIPKTSKNTEGAYLFIDFMCRTDIAVKNAEYIEYSTPHKEALDELDESYKDSHVFNPSAEELVNMEAFVDLGETSSLYNKAWEQLRLSSGEDNKKEKNLFWIYIVIAIVVIAAVVFLIIRKKQKDKIKYDE
ncbi:MAG: ABC transporter substrate-binding protein [Clostridia bacterium]|nr:ABC transporter substrate-binding protein [Clostridia bacterium]